MELESYAFVLLRWPPGLTPLPEAEEEALQAQHLAYMAGLAERGKLVGAGPFEDQEDETLRGLCFYATSVEEARELAQEDPKVRAGRLAVEVMTWWTQKGSVSFHRR
jgi:uncharacterized protein YciI